MRAEGNTPIEQGMVGDAIPKVSSRYGKRLALETVNARRNGGVCKAKPAVISKC